MQLREIRKVLSMDFLRKTQTDVPRILQPSRYKSFSAFTALPYIQDMSNTIQRVLNAIGILVDFKPLLAIGRCFSAIVATKHVIVQIRTGLKTIVIEMYLKA